MKSFKCLSRSLPSTARVATSAATRGRTGDQGSRVCAHADAPTCTLAGTLLAGRELLTAGCVLTPIFSIIKVNWETKANVSPSPGSKPGHWQPACTLLHARRGCQQGACVNLYLVSRGGKVEPTPTPTSQRAGEGALVGKSRWGTETHCPGLSPPFSTLNVDYCVCPSGV